MESRLGIKGKAHGQKGTGRGFLLVILPIRCCSILVSLMLLYFHGESEEPIFQPLYGICVEAGNLVTRLPLCKGIVDALSEIFEHGLRPA